MATFYVIFSIIGNVSDKLAAQAIAEPYSDMLGFIVLPIVCWILYNAQISVNILSGDRSGEANSQLTPLNYLWIVLGGLAWMLMIIGYYDSFIGIPDFG